MAISHTEVKQDTSLPLPPSPFPSTGVYFYIINIIRIL